VFGFVLMQFCHEYFCCIFLLHLRNCHAHDFNFVASWNWLTKLKLRLTIRLAYQKEYLVINLSFFVVGSCHVKIFQNYCKYFGYSKPIWKIVFSHLPMSVVEIWEMEPGPIPIF
jgi:hypothetical protein